MDGHADLVRPTELADAFGLDDAGGQGELFGMNGAEDDPLGELVSHQFDTLGAPVLEPGAGSCVIQFPSSHASKANRRSLFEGTSLPGLDSAERAQLLENCLHAQENERLKLGRELHDSTGQLLLALRLEITRLREVHGTSAEGSLLDEIEETAREIDREIRAFSFTHYPAEIGRDGLGPALRSLARGFASRTGLRIRYSSIPDTIAQTGQVALALLRVAQEALLNVHRHAQALHVQVGLIHRGDMLELTIRDDGIGIPHDHSLEESHGVGLLGMRHRVERLGGHFAIRRLKHGTKIVAAVPA